MICIKCKEKIPIISNLDFEEATILLYCQCDNENTNYFIKDYLKELNNIKEEQNIYDLKNQSCFIHKKNNIELFCIDCSKELCYDCDLKIHQKENHQLIKLYQFYNMIEENIKYYCIINDLIYFSKLNQKYIREIIKFIEYAYISFYEQKNKTDVNFTPLKNICYIELRLYEYDNNKDFIQFNDKINLEKENKKNKKYLLNEKINNIRHYSEVKKIELKNQNKNHYFSFFNILLIPNSYLCVLISSYHSILLVNIHSKEKKLEKMIETEYKLNSKIYSSIYNLSLLNEEIFALIYTSGSFDLFFIKKSSENNGKKHEIILIKKSYNCLDKSTNIIKQIKLSNEKNKIVVLMNDKIKILEYKEIDENLICINEIESNNIILLKDLYYHNSILSLYNNGKIIINDFFEKKNYIIKGKNINFICEIKSMNFLAINYFDNYINIFDLNIMTMKTKLIGHKNIINDVKELIPLKHSSYKTKMISCSDDNTVRIWDLNRFVCELVINFEKGGILCTLNILPEKEILVLTNENIINIIE